MSNDNRDSAGGAAAEGVKPADKWQALCWPEALNKVASAAPAAAAQVSDDVNEVLRLADAYVVAATGDTATTRHQFSSAREILRSALQGILSRASSHQAARDAEPVMLNGLTQAETDATASVMGLVHSAAPSGDKVHRAEGGESVPSAGGSEQ